MNRPDARFIEHEPTLIRARKLPDGSVVRVFEDGSTRPFDYHSDWARVDAMTEEEIEANALSDPDNPPITDEQWARMHRVPNPNWDQGLDTIKQ
jgi:hypothetical protein